MQSQTEQTGTKASAGAIALVIELLRALYIRAQYNVIIAILLL